MTNLIGPTFLKGSIPQIVPFSVRETPTILSNVEAMRVWIRDQLVPFVNSSITILYENWDSEKTELIEGWETLSTLLVKRVDDAVAEMGNSVDEAQAAKLAAEAARDLAELYASQVESIQDQAVNGLISNINSITRVKLDTLYASSTALSDVAEILTSGRLSSESLDSRYALGSELDSLSESIPPLIESAITLYDNSKKFKFNLATAKVAYGANMGTTDIKSVAQSTGVVPENGYMYYSQYITGTVADRETVVVTLCRKDGSVIGSMTFYDAGHGNGVFLEYVESEAKHYVWTSVADWSKTGNERFHVIRIPWTTGGFYTYSQVSSYVLPALDGVYRTVHYDVTTKRVGVRSNASPSVYDLTIHDIAKLKAGIWEPVSSMLHDWGGEETIQGYVPLSGVWYMLAGSSEDWPTGSKKALIYEVNQDGSKGAEISLESMRIPMTGVKMGTSEMEGLSTIFDDNGNGGLCAGVSYGPTGSRMQKLVTATNGTVTFTVDPAKVDYTGWSSQGITMQPGFSRDTTRPYFSWAIRNGMLCLYGRIDGAFPEGDTHFLTLPEWGKPPSTQQLVGLKNISTTSPEGAIRVQLGTGGDMRTLPSAELSTGGFTFLFIPYQEIPLKDFPTK